MEIRPPSSQASIQFDSVDGAFTLKPGQRLEGLVLSAEEVHSNEIEINGKIFRAHTSHTLSAGLRLEMEVLKSLPRAELRVLNAPFPVTLKLLHTAPKSGAGGQNLLSLPWKQGEIVTAKVAAASSDQVKLQLNKSGAFISLTFKIDQNLARALTTGQTLALLTGRISPVLEFSILPSFQSMRTAEALRKYLPANEPHSVFLNRLSSIFQGAGNTSGLSPEQIQHARTILQNLPSLTQLFSGGGLEQSAASSGMFLESKLRRMAEKKIMPEDDYKSALLKFIKSVAGVRPQRPGEEVRAILKTLRDEAGGSLARLVLNQLASTLCADDAGQIWRFELPFLVQDRVDSVIFEIERKKTGAFNEDGGWRIDIALNPEGLGPVNCRLIQSNGSLAAYFQADRKKTAELIGKNLAVLRESLVKSGFNPNSLEVLKTLPATASKDAKYDGRIFSEHA